MSGEKSTFVNLSGEERAHALEACRYLSHPDAEVRQRLQESRHTIQQTLQTYEDTTQRRQRSVQQEANQFSPELQTIEQQESQYLQQLAGHFYQTMEEVATAQPDDYYQAAVPHMNSLSQAFTTQRHAWQNTLMDVQQQRTHTPLAQQAQIWAHDCETLVHIIQQNYAYQNFEYSTWQHINTELASMHSLLQQGNDVAAISAAQQVYAQAQHYRLQLLQHEMLHEAYVYLARYACEEVRIACEAQKNMELSIDTTADPVTLAVDVEYWSEGEFSRLQGRIIQLQQRLDLPTNLSHDALKQLLEDVQALKKQVAGLLPMVKENVIASQLRNNIAQTIEQSLRDAGWEVADSTYAGEDFRQAVHVKLVNFAGDEIVSIISPEVSAEEVISNHLNIAFFDHQTNDEESRAQRVSDITRLLQDSGLQCSSPECVEGTEEQASEASEKLDFDHVRRQYSRR